MGVPKWPRVVFTCRSATLTILANSNVFCGLLLTVFRSRSDFHSCWTPRRAYVSVINIHSFGWFWPVSWTITLFFGPPEWFPRLTNHGVHLRVGHQHSQFWPILARFLDYYSVFGSRRDFHDWRTPGCIYVSLINTRSFGRFWPVSWSITHCFGVSKWFQRLTNRGVHLRFGHQHLHFCPILAFFCILLLAVLGSRSE